MCCRNECGCNGCCPDGEDCVPQEAGNGLRIESFLDQMNMEEAELMREIVEGDCYQEGVAGSRKLLMSLLIYFEQNLTEEEKVRLAAGVYNPTMNVKGSKINLYCSYGVAKELIREINKLREYTIFFPIQNKHTKEIVKIGMALKREVRESVHDRY